MVNYIYNIKFIYLLLFYIISLQAVYFIYYLYKFYKLINNDLPKFNKNYIIIIIIKIF
jgi:hypothetical protein